MKKTKNDGKKSESIFQDRIATLGKKAFLHRITDTREVSRGKQMIQVKATPADWLLVWPQGMGFAEVKSTQQPTTFSFSCLTTGQNVAMHRTVAAKGNYWVFVHHLLTNTWYQLPGDFIVYLLSIGKKSMLFNDMEQFKCPILNNTQT